jgi:hypothetical protein
MHKQAYSLIVMNSTEGVQHRVQSNLIHRTVVIFGYIRRTVTLRTLLLLITNPLCAIVHPHSKADIPNIILTL